MVPRQKKGEALKKAGFQNIPEKTLAGAPERVKEEEGPRKDGENRRLSSSSVDGKKKKEKEKSRRFCKV